MNSAESAVAVVAALGLAVGAVWYLVGPLAGLPGPDLPVRRSATLVVPALAAGTLGALVVWLATPPAPPVAAPPSALPPAVGQPPARPVPPAVAGPTTADAGDVSVDEHTIAVMPPDAGTRTFWVLEMVVLRNRGDATWLPSTSGPNGPMGLLRFSLPEGAGSLTLGDNLTGGVVVVDRGFATTTPVPPGRLEVTYAYTIRYGGDGYLLAEALPMATASLVVELPADIAGDVAGLQPDPTPLAGAGGAAFRRFSARDLPAGHAVAVHLRNLPGAPLEVLAPAVRWAALAAGLAAAAGAAAYAARQPLPRAVPGGARS
jgi:hypothetical protein